MYEHQRGIIDTDIESILNGEVPLRKTVRVSGKLRLFESTMAYEERTGRIRKMEYVYSLHKIREGEILSVWVKSDDLLEEGEEVVITGELLPDTYGFRRYLIDVKAEAPISIHWLFCIHGGDFRTAWHNNSAMG